LAVWLAKQAMYSETLKPVKATACSKTSFQVATPSLTTMASLPALWPMGTPMATPSPHLRVASSVVASAS
jgi:hypothetical protein